MPQLPSEDDTPFSAPSDVPEVMPDDYPGLDSNVDLHEAYDEGIDDLVDADPYRPDDDPGASHELMRQGAVGGREMYTTNHDQIRRWVEDRGGSPSRTLGSEYGLDKGGLYIRFADEEPDVETKSIDWTEFFKLFDGFELAFLFRNRTPSGSQSRFYEFIDRIAASRITEAKEV